MKKKIYILFLIITICIATPIVYHIIKINKIVNNINDDDLMLDSASFKYEYEILNNNDDNNEDKEQYIKIDIPVNNKIKYATFEEITSLLDNGTGIIYFGFPKCPWCRRTLPVFFKACNEYNIDKIYYYNALELRDVKHLDASGNIITDKQGDEKYYYLIEKLNDYLGNYEGLNNPDIKRLYFPTYVFIKDGNIVGVQISSVKSYTSTKEDMTDDQKTELLNTFKKYLDKLYLKNTNCADNQTTTC